MTKYRLNVLCLQYFCEGHKPTIPYEAQQRLPITVEQIEYQIAQGMAVSGVELRRAIECSVGRPLDDRLREVISMFSVAAVKRRGRPSSCRGREDFAMEELDRLYSDLLQTFQDDADRKSVSKDPSPSERAYRQLATEMKDDLGNIDWRSVANKHSVWKKRSIPTDDQYDSEDFDAEIERLFPRPPRS